MGLDRCITLEVSGGIVHSLREGGLTGMVHWVWGEGLIYIRERGRSSSRADPALRLQCTIPVKGVGADTRRVSCKTSKSIHDSQDARAAFDNVPCGTLGEPSPVIEKPLLGVHAFLIGVLGGGGNWRGKYILFDNYLLTKDI